MTTPTVLMADDSIPLHALVRTQLQRDSLLLESAYDGESALLMAASMQPSLILLDIDLPRRDGFDVCRALKADPVTAKVPLVFLTADTVLESKIKGLDLGAADYITKPFKADELRARVRSALRVKNPDEGSTMFDAQTGLRSRTYLEAHLPARLSIARQSGRPLACIVGFINEYRALGATHGAAICGGVQRAVGHILQGHCRGDDLLSRIGEGKFAILLNSTNIATATKIADRLAADIASRMHSYEGVKLNVGCTFGVIDTHGVSEGDDLIARADAAAQLNRHLS